jgi:hypothetical protein
MAGLRLLGPGGPYRETRGRMALQTETLGRMAFRGAFKTLGPNGLTGTRLWGRMATGADRAR